MHTFNVSPRRFCQLGLAALLMVLAACTTVKPPEVVVQPEVPQVPAPRKVPKLGLALGGGAARGFAHIGVIQVLEENGIKPDMVVGTSAGSVVAAFYASGKTGAQLQWLADSMDESQLTDWTVPFMSRGMLRGEALGRYINTQLNGAKIEDLKIPLGIVATDCKLATAFYSGAVISPRRCELLAPYPRCSSRCALATKTMWTVDWSHLCRYAMPVRWGQTSSLRWIFQAAPKTPKPPIC